MQLFLWIISALTRFDISKGALTSILSAGLGSTLAEITQVAPTPVWFMVLSPVLQCLAWAVAVMAGILTMVLTVIKIINTPKKQK